MGKIRDTREAVEAELAFDPLVDASDIDVKVVGPGEVALTGTVSSYPQYREAAEAAQRLATVTDVHNHLAVVLPPGDSRDDATLAAAANNALALSIIVPNGIVATAHDGNLRLNGTVNYGSQRLAAEMAVAGLTGVRNIKNHIDIAYDADPIDVTFLVQDALDRYALIPDDSDVIVNTDGHAVTLQGHVRTWAEHDAAIGAAWMASGVFDVRDRLVVTG
jgi:osmotically-inducible protein OsmY